MSVISISRHDYLGKLSIVKNYLFLVLRDNRVPLDIKEKIQTAYNANEDLILLTKNSPAIDSSK